MNSMYVYCDVVLFLGAKLPELDMTVRTCMLVPSEYDWSFFIDVVQFQSSSSSDLDIRKSDIVTSINKDTNPTVAKLKNLKTPTSISFLRRPYGRPNCIPADERGWLFAERISIAIRVAAAPLSQFDDIVVSNNENLRKEIFGWSKHLRDAAKKEKKIPGSIKHVLEEFKCILAQKRFSWPNNDVLVIEIMTNLVKKFEQNWAEESKRQRSMGKRARELLLRWGCFSEQYIEKARFLNGQVKTPYSFFAAIIFIAPLLAIVPFTFEIDVKKVGLSSMWLSLTLSAVRVILPLSLIVVHTTYYTYNNRPGYSS